MANDGTSLMSIKLGSTVAAAAGQVSCNLGGEEVILDVGAGLYYGLNEIGARVWQLIQEPRTVRTVRDLLLHEYDVDPETCERDLLALLGELRSCGLVQVRSQAASWHVRP